MRNGGDVKLPPVYVKGDRVPVHTTLVVHREMLMAVLANYHTVPALERFTLEKIVLMYDYLRPTLRAVTKKKD